MLSILIPNHKEKEIQTLIKEIENLLPVHEIIISNDSESKGKGWAIRQALMHAKGDLIAMLDGDNEIPARMLLRLLPFLDDFSVVVGSKRITQSPLRRKIMTHLTRIWFKLLFGLYVDSQTGIKLFKREALEALPHYAWRANGFIHDVEILSHLQKKGFKMVEVPIECQIRRQLAFKTIFRIFGESIWLFARLLFRVK